MAIELAMELIPRARGNPSATGNLDEGPRRAHRILVTRALDQSDVLMSALRGAGLEPILVPAISIEFAPPGSDLDRAAGSLHGYHWVVVTSANGARAILKAAERIRTDLGSPRWGAIGTATRATLEREGIDVDFAPSRANGLAMASEMPLRAGDRVLVIRGDLPGPDLAERLRSRGADVDDVIGYGTLEAPATSRALLRQAIAAGPFAAIIFTSGSTIRGLRSLSKPDAVDVMAIPAVCIGPETAAQARDAGFQVIAVASSQDAASLAATAASVLTRQPQEIT